MNTTVQNPRRVHFAIAGLQAKPAITECYAYVQSNHKIKNA